jgi:autotransporter-associated beta strand protein
MTTESRRTLKLLAIGAAAALLPLRAQACFYHWSHGLPEPTGVWPANLTVSSGAPVTAADAALVATAAVQDLDTSNASYINSWLINTTGATGKSTSSTINAAVDTIPANVQEVAYTATDVYIKATGIPDYDIGPFNGNPNVPANDNATFDIIRNPTPATGTHTATGLGAIGVLLNGVDFFNISDSMSYQNKGVWYDNAGVVEAPSFDAANAHPQQQGVYHNHENPVSLESEIGAASTNPMVIGYAIDGYPLMNDYASLTAGGPIVQMMSGYELKTYTNNVRGNGGPNISTQYSDGYFEQDYQYVASQSLPSGEAELDQYNGAFVYTPQFPDGTYAYFATTDSAGKTATYPYLVGPTYYGTPASDDLAGATVTVPADAVVYTPPATLTWNNINGTGTGTTWDTTSKNWNNSSSATTFSSINADNVTFNDTNNGHYSVTISTTVTPGSTTVNNSAGNYTFTGAGGIGGSGALTKSGTAALTLSTTNTYTGGTIVSAGTLILSGSGAFPSATALSISAGATAQIAAHTGGSAGIVVIKASQLTFSGTAGSWGGLLDLTNNSAIVTGGSLSNVTSQIAEGFASGSWNGTAGIISSTAAADTSHLTAVGVIKNDNAGTAVYSTFDNTSTVDGDILVKYTWYGDANLDGAVDGSDYTKIDAGFSSAGKLTGWANGDFNYDGKIDGSDYTLIDNAFNTQAATLGSNPLALVADSTAQIAAVPEPASVGLIGIALIARLRRRRR